MVTLFYVFICLLIVYEVINLLNVSSRTKTLFEVYKTRELLKNLEYDDFSETQKTVAKRSFIGILELVLLVFGLMTSQWYLFLLVLIIEVSSGLIMRLFPNYKFWIFINTFGSLISIIILILSIINNFN